MKAINYSHTLQAILQGARFKAVHGINGVIHTYQLEEIGYSLWLIKFKGGTIRSETDFAVDKVLTKNDTLVLETAVLGKRLEAVFNCDSDIELIKED